MEIVKLTPDNVKLWDEAARRHEGAWAYHLSELVFAFVALYGARNRSFLIVENGRVLAQLPLYLLGRSLQSIEPAGPLLSPALNYREKRGVMAALVAEVERLAVQDRAKRIALQATHLSAGALAGTERNLLCDLLPNGYLNASFMLHRCVDLTKPEAELWNNLKKGTRYLVKRAEKQKLEFACYDQSNLTPAIMKDFYDACVKVCKRGGYQGALGDFPTFNFRQELIERGLALLYVIKTEGKIVDYAFILRYGVAAYYYSGALEPAYAALEPSHYLHWQIMLDLKKRGDKCYDLGFQDYSSLYRTADRKSLSISTFKAGFGGDNILLFEVEKPLAPLSFLRAQITRAVRAVLNKREYFRVADHE
ncbi:MAG: GNAT family N-acetyltransferase [Candidatus Margulisiibacteriota bacterium]